MSECRYLSGSRCKGPVVEACLLSSGLCTKASMAERKWMEVREHGWRVMAGHGDLVGHCNDLVEAGSVLSRDEASSYL